MQTFTCSLAVRFAETDAFGIVYYPNIFRYFDLAVENLLREAPYDHFGNLRESGAGFPALEAGGAFGSPIFAGDEITIETDVEDVRTRAFRVRHRILRGEDVLATGYEVRIYARKPPGAATIEGLPLPDDLRAYLLGE
ncbi:MAG: acyl-CoA thioesterase [Candidatus Eremiobacteraeota bacterium]|nr:acyl-CoA thioesterase [Candidatus Eremiobacteraeota bacterium]